MSIIMEWMRERGLQMFYCINSLLLCAWSWIRPHRPVDIINDSTVEMQLVWTGLGLGGFQLNTRNITGIFFLCPTHRSVESSAAAFQIAYFFVLKKDLGGRICLRILSCHIFKACPTVSRVCHVDAKKAEQKPWQRKGVHNVYCSCNE